MATVTANITPFLVTRKGQVLSVILSATATTARSSPKTAAQQMAAYRSSGRRSTAFREAPSLPFLRPAETNANTRQAKVPTAPTSTIGSHQLDQS